MNSASAHCAQGLLGDGSQVNVEYMFCPKKSEFLGAALSVGREEITRLINVVWP